MSCLIIGNVIYIGVYHIGGDQYERKENNYYFAGGRQDLA